MNQCIKGEFLYLQQSYLAVKFFLLLTALFSVILLMNYASVKQLHSDYQFQVDFHNENGDDINTELDKEFKITTNKTNSLTTIDNPLSYYKNILEHYVVASGNKYRLSQLFEASLVIFPIVFGLFGSILATVDFKFKTIKIKAVRFNRIELALGKQLTLILATLIILVIALLISFNIGFIVNLSLHRQLNLSAFKIDLTMKPLLYKIIWVMFLAIFFSELGYTIGYISKSTTISLLGIFMLSYIIPTLNIDLLGFDINNSLMHISTTFFDYYGVIAPSNIKNSSLFYSLLTIFFYTLLMVISNLHLIKNRPNYE